MDSILQQILIQAACYGSVILLTIFGLSMLMRGFFWKFIKVRTSFNRLLLVKQRTLLRDCFYIGWIDNNSLIFKDKKDGQKYEARIDIDSSKKTPIYRCLGCNWIDIDEDKTAVCNPDYSTVAGYDSKKHSDLMVRCLQRPTITNGQPNLNLIILIGIAILSLACLYLLYNNYESLRIVKLTMPTICQAAASTITATAGTI